MNVGLDEVGNTVLVVSQFTLAGSIRRGRRPDFFGAAPPEEASRSSPPSSRRSAPAASRSPPASSAR